MDNKESYSLDGWLFYYVNPINEWRAKNNIDPPNLDEEIILTSDENNLLIESINLGRSANHCIPISVIDTLIRLNKKQ